jgi:hypothetical protein
VFTLPAESIHRLTAYADSALPSGPNSLDAVEGRVAPAKTRSHLAGVSAASLAGRRARSGQVDEWRAEKPRELIGDGGLADSAFAGRNCPILGMAPLERQNVMRPAPDRGRRGTGTAERILYPPAIGIHVSIDAMRGPGASRASPADPAGARGPPGRHDQQPGPGACWCTRSSAPSVTP